MAYFVLFNDWRSLGEALYVYVLCLWCKHESYEINLEQLTEENNGEDLYT